MALLSQDQSISSTYVHTEGAVSLCYSPDARYLYSGGADGIRCFDLTQSVDAAKTIEYHKDAVTCLDCSADFLASSSESGETVLHEHAATSDQAPAFKALMTRTSLATRGVRFSPNQRKLAVCSDELYIKIVDVKDPLQSSLLTGHTKSIKAIAWSPDSQLLVTAGCDAVIRIWNLSKQQNPSSESSSSSQEIDHLLPSSVLPESLQSVEPVWHPSGKYFLVPNRESGLTILSRSSGSEQQGWKRGKTVCQSGQSKQTKPVTALRFSLNGKYLATGCQDGIVVIWATQSWTPEATIQPEPDAAITAIQWRPNANAIVAANQLGQVIHWRDAVPPTQPPPFNPPSLVLPTTTESSTRLVEDQDGDVILGDDLDPMDADDGYDNEDWVIDDLDVGKTTSSSKVTAPHHHRTSAPSSRNRHLRYAQEPFQPGATTLKLRSLETRSDRRFLAFNLLGYVHILEKEDENIVTVEFHNKGLYRGYHFTDTFKFNLGSMGNLGLAFACSATRSNASVVRYVPFESWTTTGFAFRGSEKVGVDEEGSWEFELPTGESATCLGCGGCADAEGKMERDGLAGSGVVAVGTSQGYLRLFSGSGMQTYVWNLGQEIVSVACSHEFVFLVHRPSIASSYSQPLSYTLMDCSSFEIVQEGPIPLPPNTDVVLAWIGFSHPHAIPACYDSAGVLSFLDKARRPRQGRWVPMLATASLKSDAQLDRVYWPVGVSDSELSCIILKGGETQPSIPAPIIQEVPLHMPLLEQDSPQSQLEESYLRGSLIHQHQADLADPEDGALASQLSMSQLELEKQVLKLIESCCKAEPEPQLQKALDCAAWLQSMNTLEAGQKISKFFNLAGLEERMGKLREARALQGEVSGGGKRRSRYAHLEDYDIIVDSRAPSKRKAGGSAGAFERPFDDLPSARPAAAPVGRPFDHAAVFRAPPPVRRADQVAALEEQERYRDRLDLSSTLEVSTDSFMHDAVDDDDLASLSSSVKRPKLSEYTLSSQATQSTARESTNPFAKKPGKGSSGMTSGTPGTSGGGLMSGGKLFGTSSRTPELKKPDKFFDRVDERHGLATAGSKKKTLAAAPPPPLAKVKQATLFDLQAFKKFPDKPPPPESDSISQPDS
ncbi:hypothetical protein PCANC_17781 [Puccinia coronata f. sp. avenae]|uniref:Uncharacterized protein n=1 Tax=Puccinia coronata f. sp. avenae TaxID=200324 RepID=A0A2N5SJ83_9BASI|nr:hypothetical protein PCANC_17781 [Puccinia coronata f. sp. avenae]